MVFRRDRSKRSLLKVKNRYDPLFLVQQKKLSYFAKALINALKNKYLEIRGKLTSTPKKF